MKKILQISFFLAYIFFGCSEYEKDYFTKIQADWKNSNGRALSFQDTLYSFGWAAGGGKFEIIDDTLRLYNDFYDPPDLLVRKLTDHSLWLRNLGKIGKDSLDVYRKIETYSDNIDIERIEFKSVPDGRLGYRIYLIEGKNIYLQVAQIGRRKNDPNFWPVETGYYMGSIPDSIYNVILSKFRNIRFGELKNSYDGWYHAIRMNIQLRRLDDNEIKKVQIVGSSFPAEVRLLVSYLFKLSKHVNLEKIDNPPEFELTPIPIALEAPDDFDESHITSGSY